MILRLQGHGILSQE